MSGVDTRRAADAWREAGEYLSNPNRVLLSGELREGLHRDWVELTDQEARLDDTILIGLVGGTGVGKSTFINALAQTEVSTSSDRRPTTDRVVVYRHADVPLAPDVPTDHLSQPQVLHRNDALERVLLLDFPDFDSAEASHRDILASFLPHLDVLFVVADDMKYGDRRLYDLLGGLSQDSGNLFCLLSKLDRLRARYGDDADRVADEIVADFSGKLREFAGLDLGAEQMLRVSSIAEIEGRPGDAGEFDRVRAILDRYRDAKRRRAAKELNLDVRKRQLVERLQEAALTDDRRVTIEAAERAIASWRSELDGQLGIVSPALLSGDERRAMRRSAMRAQGGSWGFPFSLVFRSLGELRSRSGSAGAESIDAETRIRSHYRPFLDSLGNLRTRLAADLRGTGWFGGADENEAGRSVDSTLREVAAEFDAAVRPPPGRVGGKRRVVSHVPALVVVGFAAWWVIYPVFRAAVSGDDGVLSSLGSALLVAISPIFLLSVVICVVAAYLISAGWIWSRAAQRAETAILDAEERVKERIRALAGDVVRDLGDHVEALRSEFRSIEGLTRLKE